MQKITFLVASLVAVLAVSLQGTLQESAYTVPPPPPSAENKKIENPWQGLVDSKTGRIYYWNTATQETTWQRPASFPAPVLAAAPPAQNTLPAALASVTEGTTTAPTPKSTKKGNTTRAGNNPYANVTGCQCPGSHCCRGAIKASTKEIGTKRTPGKDCKYFKTCQSCMILSWCQWSLTYKNCSHGGSNREIYSSTSAECGIESMPTSAELIIPRNETVAKQSSSPNVDPAVAKKNNLTAPIVSNRVFAGGVDFAEPSDTLFQNS